MSSTNDLKNNINVEPSILPQTATANVNGAEVDIRGFDSATLVGTLDDTASAAGTYKIQESDTSGSGYTDVSADDIIGTNDVAAVGSDVVTIGYAGTKRYLRAVFTHSLDGDVCANFILAAPHVAKTGANS